MRNPKPLFDITHVSLYKEFLPSCNYSSLHLPAQVYGNKKSAQINLADFQVLIHSRTVIANCEKSWRIPESNR